MYNQPTDAGLGFGKKKKNEKDDGASTSPGDSNDGGGTASAAIDLSDPELIEAMEHFAQMSPEEIEEAFAEVIDILGDDPDTIAAVREVMAEMESMDADDVTNSVKTTMETVTLDDEIAEATQIALDMISKSEWDVIYDKRGDILDSVIASGKISAEDAALYKSDEGEWEKELRFIWDELQRQASGTDRQDQGGIIA